MSSPTRPRVDFVATLADRGQDVAVHSSDTSLTYAALADQVAAAGLALGSGRRLVLIAAENSLDALVTYLGALHAGHVPLLAPGDRLQHLDGLIDAYDPDVVAGRGDRGWRVTARRTRAGHDLHADLALLLTTSGRPGRPSWSASRTTTSTATPHPSPSRSACSDRTAP